MPYSHCKLRLNIHNKIIICEFLKLGAENHTQIMNTKNQR